MSEPIKQIIRFILFILVQALVLSHMPPVHRFITPYLYFLFILWLPFFTSRFWVLIIGFILGFTLDMFTKTPGLHASACVLISFIRPFLISLLVPKETKELTLGSPGIKSMGAASYAVYVILLTLFHHAWLVFLEWMDIGSFTYFLGKVFFSGLVSLLLILVTEMLFKPLKKTGNR
ncbi:MAG: rod shape-determining protein MreD [Bacteroidota bacterium]